MPVLMVIDLGKHAKTEGWNKRKEASDASSRATYDWIGGDVSIWYKHCWDVSGELLY